MFDISPTEEVGDFEVKAKFMGVEMEKVQLHFQVNTLLLSVDSEGVFAPQCHDALSCWKCKIKMLCSEGFRSVQQMMND